MRGSLTYEYPLAENKDGLKVFNLLDTTKGTITVGYSDKKAIETILLYDENDTYFIYEGVKYNLNDFTLF